MMMLEKIIYFKKGITAIIHRRIHGIFTKFAQVFHRFDFCRNNPATFPFALLRMINLI